MEFIYDYGGRKAAGFKGSASDCVARSVAIASGKPYQEVYTALAAGAGQERGSKGRSARNGIRDNRKWFKDLMRSWGFVWVPTMGIGTGCKVHLKTEELPKGRLIVSPSRHWTAVIDGVIHDTYDPSRDGSRCVYGYWIARPCGVAPGGQGRMSGEAARPASGSARWRARGSSAPAEDAGDGSRSSRSR